MTESNKPTARPTPPPVANPKPLKIYSKILDVQSKVGTLSKSKDNPFFKSKYFDVNQILEQLMPLLHANKLTIMQPITVMEGVQVLLTNVIDTEDNTLITMSAMQLPEIADPQKLGSAVTYFRRYALQSLFALQAEDDDGNKAAAKEVPKVDHYSVAEKAINSAKSKPQFTRLTANVKASKNLKAAEKTKLNKLIESKVAEIDAS